MPTQATPTARSASVALSLSKLAAEGKVTGLRSSKISARVDPGVYAAAAARLGVAPEQVSEVINAALAVTAAPDRFKAWWDNPGDPLPDDFELAI